MAAIPLPCLLVLAITEKKNQAARGSLVLLLCNIAAWRAQPAANACVSWDVFVTPLGTARYRYCTKL